MIDTLMSWSALPNLHPAVVHFPIAFVTLALLFDVAALFHGDRSWLDRAATATWVAAGLGAGLAFWAGRRAADSVLVTPRVQVEVNHHADWGLYTLWLVGVVAAARLAFGLWQERRVGQGGRRAGLALFVAAGAAALGFVSFTADLGGNLVYRHGVAVATRTDEPEERGPGETAEERDETETGTDGAGGGDPAARLGEGEDGTLTWRPAPGDAGALGVVLTPAAGSSLGSVSVEPVADGSEGLSLAVAGRSLLVLPGSFGDVQVEAALDLSGFEGTVGLAHHVRGADDAGLFTVERPGGRFALITVEGGEARTLGAEIDEVPDGVARFVVSAIGRHLRGLVGEELVVHGHEPALPDGACGLLLDGRGTVRVVELKIVPASR